MSSSETDMSTARAVHRLGWRLLSNATIKSATDKSAALSPMSIAVAIAMLAGAAQREKKETFFSKLGMELPQDGKSPPDFFAFKSADDVLTLANAIFVDRTVSILGTYSEYLQGFDAESKTYPSLSGSVDEINDWITEKTRGYIRNMLNGNTLRQSHAILVNALAFSGTWKTKFNARHTIPDHTFRVGSGEPKKIKMMYKRGEKVATVRSSTYTAISLPYESSSEGGEMSMLAYLPSEDTSIQSVAEEIAEKGPATSFQSLKYAKLGFPQFEINADFSLLPQLQTLGFPVEGEFPGFGQGSNIVQDVLHKAFVKVNEEGTEAAAATVVAMTRSIRPNAEPMEILIFDRPFLFSVIDGRLGIPVISGIFAG